MPDFSYTARKADGAVIKGQRSANSEASLAEILSLDGLTLQAQPTGKARHHTRTKWDRLQRISVVRKIFTQNPSIMVKTAPACPGVKDARYTGTK